MDIKEILGRCDHTLLTVDATWEDIRAIVDDGIAYSTASVCIPPCYVKAAAEYAVGRVAVCTVIGFPCGYSGTEVKVAECRRAVLDGADEIDMVINVGYLKAGRHAEVLAEINAVKAAAVVIGALVVALIPLASATHNIFIFRMVEHCIFKSKGSCNSVIKKQIKRFVKNSLKQHSENYKCAARVKIVRCRLKQKRMG